MANICVLYTLYFSLISPKMHLEWLCDLNYKQAVKEPCMNLYTHDIHIHTNTYIHIYVYVCVCWYSTLPNIGSYRILTLSCWLNLISHFITFIIRWNYPATATSISPKNKMTQISTNSSKTQPPHGYVNQRAKHLSSEASPSSGGV